MDIVEKSASQQWEPPSDFPDPASAPRETQTSGKLIDQASLELLLEERKYCSNRRMYHEVRLRAPKHMSKILKYSELQTPGCITLPEVLTEPWMDTYFPEELFDVLAPANGTVGRNIVKKRETRNLIPKEPTVNFDKLQNEETAKKPRRESVASEKSEEEDLDEEDDDAEDYDAQQYYESEEEMDNEDGPTY